MEARIQIQYLPEVTHILDPSPRKSTPPCLRLLFKLLDVLSYRHSVHSVSSTGISGVEITTAKTRVINGRQAEIPDIVIVI